jgi:hypothetical protein
VLAAGPDGNVTQGRNMDNSPDQLRNLSIHSMLRVGGVVVAEAMDWYWSGAGFMTVFMPGVVSMQENWRMLYQDVNGSEIVDGIAAGAMSQNWFFREALFTRNLRAFDDIVKFVATTPTPGPMYGIIAGAGKNQGAIVTRDPYREIPVILLSAQSTWYLVQTNYDHWLPDPKDDPRRVTGEKLLHDAGQAVATTLAGMMQVMNTYPIRNEGTVFSAALQPASGASVWVGQGPM